MALGIGNFFESTKVYAAKIASLLDKKILLRRKTKTKLSRTA